MDRQGSRALRDTVAAMIEANRTIYRDKDKVVPIMVERPKKPKAAVEFAWEIETRTASGRSTPASREAHASGDRQQVENGDIEAAKKPTVEQVAISSSPRKRWNWPAAPSPLASARSNGER